MEKISFDQVFKTYNGKTGCACGCNGAYSLPSADLIDDANKTTGYEAYDADDVRPRACKIALSKINKAIEQYGPLAKPDNTYLNGVEYVGNDVWFFACTDFVAIDAYGRSSTVYLRKDS